MQLNPQIIHSFKAHLLEKRKLKVDIYYFRGSAIAKLVGLNAARLPYFEDRVTMYVYEEDINGEKLTEIINTRHENVKYLPGHILPENVVSIIKNH